MIIVSFNNVKCFFKMRFVCVDLSIRCDTLKKQIKDYNYYKTMFEMKKSIQNKVRILVLISDICLFKCGFLSKDWND
jgi:hypothetical protein